MLVIRLTLCKADCIPNHKMSIVTTRASNTIICQQKLIKYQKYKQIYLSDWIKYCFWVFWHIKLLANSLKKHIQLVGLWKSNMPQAVLFCKDLSLFILCISLLDACQYIEIYKSQNHFLKKKLGIKLWFSLIIWKSSLKGCPHLTWFFPSINPSDQQRLWSLSLATGCVHALKSLSL